MYPSFYTRPGQRRTHFRVSLVFQYSQSGWPKFSFASQNFHIPAFDIDGIVIGQDNKTLSQPWWKILEGAVSPTTRVPSTISTELNASSFEEHSITNPPKKKRRHRSSAETVRSSGR
ncbi:hypothetical protein Btru_045361 [Bulinus truncatus]|nr:hypothetical protein Btru_045361 [Bulinus truncatus]